MQEKLAVLYGYNPEHLTVSPENEISILQEQLSYEKGEIKRIKKLNHLLLTKNLQLNVLQRQ